MLTVSPRQLSGGTGTGMTIPTTDTIDLKSVYDEWREYKGLEDAVGRFRYPKFVKDTTDPVKAAGLDKQFEDERYFDPDSVVGPLFGDPSPQPNIGATNVRRPFVLRTPHHAPTWETVAGSEATRRDVELAGYERAISQLEDARKRGERQLEILDQEYDSLREEYEELLEEYERSDEQDDAE